MKSTEQFIDECKKVHGEAFDYSNFNYVNNKTKGVIHCKKCGYTFEMIPTNHLNKKQGCPRCSNRLRKTTEQFIEEARKVHGDKYSYDLVDYVNAHTKVKIRCKRHGVFEQTPAKHLAGHNCPYCTHSIPIPFEEFVKKANKKHKGKYTYHEDTYTLFTNKTKIMCPKHGDFFQVAQLHANGSECPICSNENKIGQGIVTFDEFVKRAREVHGDKYEYNEDSYVKYTSKTKIFCKKHGWFEQTPQKHVDRKQECPKCAREKQSENQKLNYEEVIKRFIDVHGNKYIYEEQEYKGQTSKMKIICPLHGEFYQAPLKHWQGQGCPKCNQSHLERDVEMLLKDMNEDFVYQATKKDLNFLKMLSLDFYLPKYNVAIECQGIQHFEDNGMLKSKHVIERDHVKYELCKQNGINLIYYTNLIDKVENNEFYSDKTFFTEINNLKKFLIKL